MCWGHYVDWKNESLKQQVQLLLLLDTNTLSEPSNTKKKISYGKRQGNNPILHFQHLATVNITAASIASTQKSVKR